MKENFTKILAAILGAWSSRKLWATLAGVGVLQTLFWHAAYHLITHVPNEKIAAYEAMFQTNHYAIVLAVLSYLGVQGATDVFRRTTSSVTSVVNEFITENKKIDITETVDVNVVQKYAEKHKDDPSYRPLDTIEDLNEENFR